MSLDREELRTFTVLASELHFRKASERLFMSQPTLSRQIARLKVGGALFTRTRRKVALTETGRTLLTCAEPLLCDLDAAMCHAREVMSGSGGTLRIG
jgi:DNA-binding transcriptional LysR family regulator